MTAQQVFQRMLPPVRILYGGLVASTLLLAVVSFKIPAGTEPQPLAVTVVLVVCAVGSAVFSFVLPAVIANKPPRGERPAPEIGPDGKPLPRRFVDPAAAARDAMARGQTMLILQLALSEAVSCIGLVAHSLGEPRTMSLTLFAAGTLLAAIRFPTIASLVGPYERRSGASFAASGDGGSA
jgi:hypothetical protein